MHRDDVPDVLGFFLHDTGAMSVKSQQQDGSCNDYQIRFNCETPQIQTAELEVQSVDLARQATPEGGKSYGRHTFGALEERGTT